MYWGFGEFLGDKKFAERHKFQAAEQEYQAAMAAYEKQLDEDWRSSPQYYNLHARDQIERLRLEEQAQTAVELEQQLREETERTERARARFERRQFRVERSERSGVQLNVQLERGFERDAGSKTSMARRYLEENYSPGDPSLPGPSELARRVGVSKSSAYQAIAQFTEKSHNGNGHTKE
jgi:hypothetical protein